MRRRDRRDVPRHLAARVDHDEREALGPQRDQLLVGLGRQDHDGAGDPAAAGERRQYGGRLRVLASVEDQRALMRLQALGDRGDDQAEVVGQRVGTPQVDRARRLGPRRAAALRAEPLDGALHQLPGRRGHVRVVVEHPGHGRDRHPRGRGDVPDGARRAGTASAMRYIPFHPLSISISRSVAASLDRAGAGWFPRSDVSRLLHVVTSPRGHPHASKTHSTGPDRRPRRRDRRDHPGRVRRHRPEHRPGPRPEHRPEHHPGHRPRRRSRLEARRGPRLAHHPRRRQPVRRQGHSPLRKRAVHRPDRRGRPDPDLPDDAGLRRGHHRLLRGGALPALPRDAHRDHAIAVRPGDRRRPGLPPPADRRLGLRGERRLHLRRPAGRTNGLRAAQLLHRARQSADPPAAAAGEGHQPPPPDHRHALEPAGLDEDRRLAHRRPAHRRCARLPRLRAVPAEVRRGLPGQRRPRRHHHSAERAAEPDPVRLSGHRHAVVAGREGHRGPRPDAARRAPAHPDPGLRPQLDRAPQRRRRHPAGRDRRHQRLPPERPELPGRQVGLRHRVPLLQRRPERDDGVPQPVPGQGDLLHRVLRKPVERPGRTPSPTR